MSPTKKTTPKRRSSAKNKRKASKKKKGKKSSSGLGKLSLILLAIFTVSTVLETQFYYVEKTVGSFLNLRNKGREAYGTTWERRQQSDLAEELLEQEAGEASSIRRKAERVNSFSELMSIVPSDDGLSLSPAKFIELYLNLPAAMQSILVEQTELTNYQRGNRWQRTSIWKQGEDGAAYLIDSRNQIIKSIVISRLFLNAADSYGASTPGTLSEIPEFAGHIYPAEKFNKLFFSLTDEKRSAFFPEPGILLKLPRNIVYIGLSPSENQHDLGMIGFESETVDGNMVTRYPASASMMQQIIWKFSWENSDTLFSPDIPSTESPKNKNVTIF